MQQPEYGSYGSSGFTLGAIYERTLDAVAAALENLAD